MDIYIAIRQLHPNCTSIVGGGEDQPDAVAYDIDGNVIEYDATAVQNLIDANAYKMEREYPSIQDQLDMLYHAIDSGALDKTSDFYTSIKAVKDAHPKPTE